MKLDYRLTGHGWATATITDGASSATMTASDLGDALGDLLLAVRLLLDGEADTRCSWWEEPGEFRWRFHRAEDNVTIKVIEFPWLWSEAPDEEGTVIFETTQPVQLMASAIAAAAKAVLVEHGLDGYRSKWTEYAFPSETIASIDRALGG